MLIRATEGLREKESHREQEKLKLTIRISQPYPTYSPTIGVSAAPLHMEKGCRVFGLNNHVWGEVAMCG